MLSAAGAEPKLVTNQLLEGLIVPQRLAALAQPRIAAHQFAVRFLQYFVFLDGAAIAFGGDCVVLLREEQCPRWSSASRYLRRSSSRRSRNHSPLRRSSTKSPW